MFQRFSATTSPQDAAPRLAALRRTMAEAGLDAVLIPRADAHMGENVAPCDERLAWATGFTGSAGLCIVTADRAALFTDGRYTLQVRAQTDPALFDYQSIPEVRPADWLAANLTQGVVAGFDPWLHGRKDIADFDKALSARGIVLRPVANPVDAAWTDRPAPPRGRIVPYPAALSGEDHATRRARIGADIARAGADAAVLTLPDSIAWLLNIRGADIARTPVAHAFAILRADGTAMLFTDPAKLDDAARDHLGADVAASPAEAFGPALAALTGTVLVDETTAPVWVGARLGEGAATILWGRDPCILPKACKNAAELAGASAAHLRDAAAMAEFLHWLDNTAPQGGLTETDVVRELEQRRRATGALHDISFETICGAGPDGAIVHYRVTDQTDRPVRPGELLLVDSGGQYLDGTTDITRTVAVGTPEPDAIRAFTLVLKGMIALSLARFPEGTEGRALDTLARIAMWKAGMDYAHGTGHGVGAFLGVHEGPQSISKRGAEPLLPGMIVSNEPGYYREGHFGIRIENLIVVTPPEPVPGGDRPMLGFRTLTLAPIDRSLIDPALLTLEERRWVDDYHARVLAEVGPGVSPDTADWLARACARLQGG
jgi:Xaa-Pro aminopeptidase